VTGEAEQINYPNSWRDRNRTGIEPAGQPKIYDRKMLDHVEVKGWKT